MEELRERNDTLKEEKYHIEAQRDEEADNIVSIISYLNCYLCSLMAQNGIKMALTKKQNLEMSVPKTKFLKRKLNYS